VAEELERLKEARMDYEERRIILGRRIRRMRSERGHGRNNKQREKTR
jgi:hypothetical protein